MTMSNETQLMHTDGLNTPVVAFRPEAFEAKKLALASARAVVTVTDAVSQEAAGKALQAVAALAKQIEAAHRAIKAPVLAFGKEIDSVAKAFSAELDAEKRRLSVLVGTYQEQERAKAAKIAEAARKAEEQRLAKLAAEQNARVAEEVKGRTGTLSADIEAMQGKAVADVVAIRQEAAAATVSAPEGVGVRKSWKFEVTDLAALFKARPDLCTVEPDNAAIRAAVKKSQSIPGLRIWSESVASVRTAGAPRMALPKLVTPVNPAGSEENETAVVDNGDY